ncbi:MAG: hypothetical protein AAGG07_13440 [Planctomycetota bacterium]
MNEVRQRWLPRSRWLLFAALWFTASYYLFGDVGLWNDDYNFIQRSPETGEITRLTVINFEKGEFWRPLHLALTTTLITLLWDRPPVLHAFSAIAWGGLACLTWWVLRGAGRTGRGAAVGTIAVLCCPVLYQLVIWPSALATTMSLGLMLVACRLSCIGARHGCGWGLGVGILGIVFAASCFNEQPATMSAALPLLCLAAVPRSLPRKITVARVMLPSVYSGFACLLYIGLYTSTVDGLPGADGSSFVTDPAALGVKAADLSGSIRHWLLLWDRKDGMWSLGLAAFTDHPGRAVLVICAAAGGLAGWLSWWMGSGARRAIEEQNGGRAFFSLLCFGFVTVFLSWLPILLVRQYGMTDSRMYANTIFGLSVVLAVLVDAAMSRRWIASNRALMGAAGAAVIPLAFAGAIMLLGTQEAKRLRAERDAVEAAMWTEEMPYPPGAAFFLPLKDRHFAVRTGASLFNQDFEGPFGFPWAAGAWLRRVYERSDLFAGFYWPWPVAQPVIGIDESGVRYSWGGLGPYPGDPELTDLAGGVPTGHLLPWETIVPFAIEADGRITLYDTIRIERADNSDQEIGVPLVRTTPIRADGMGRGTWTYYDWRRDGSVGPLLGWQLEDRSKAVFERPSLWGASHTATKLGSGRAIELELPDEALSRPLHFRVTRPLDLSGSVSLRIEGPGVSQQVTLDPADSSRPRWEPVTLRINSPGMIRVTVLEGPAWVTHGLFQLESAGH